MCVAFSKSLPGISIVEATRIQEKCSSCCFSQVICRRKVAAGRRKATWKQENRNPCCNCERPEGGFGDERRHGSKKIEMHVVIATAPKKFWRRKATRKQEI